MVQLTGKQIERFWKSVKENENGCWIWQHTLNKGYGAFFVSPRYHGAHRLAYEMIKGEIPGNLVLDHLCRTPACVNPAHLEPVTRGENVLRGVAPTAVNKQKTHCNRGHEYTPENTYLTPYKGRFHRKCRTCFGYRILCSETDQQKAA